MGVRANVLQLLRPLHVAYTGEAAHALHQAGQLADVLCFDHEFDDRICIRTRARIDGADVCSFVADDRRQLFEHTGPVVAEDRNPDRVSCRTAGGLVGMARPLDGDTAVGLIEQILNIGTIAGVHRDAFATRNVAHDLFATDGIATSCAVDQQFVLALHL